MTDVNRMRISDADRSEVIDILQRATVEGRLDLDELEDRVAGALAARTWSDVDPLIDDLPVAVEPEPVEADDDRPGAPTTATHVGSVATLVVGGAAIAGSFATPWGALSGIVSAVLGAVLLLGQQELSGWDRAAVLTGMILGLLPSVFFLMLLVILDL
ncbi:DUF1707 domain-containing protein [Actinoplanes sp. NPDC051411]|uniref:DUF1707 SHOCT-like domain-containing protein n=1 Tax=Actinoplanes sp. NPDC051411 TaxID=3155522 RepID=UPI00342C9F29